MFQLRWKWCGSERSNAACKFWFWLSRRQNSMNDTSSSDHVSDMLRPLYFTTPPSGVVDWNCADDDDDEVEDDNDDVEADDAEDDEPDTAGSEDNEGASTLMVADAASAITEAAFARIPGEPDDADDDDDDDDDADDDPDAPDGADADPDSMEADAEAAADAAAAAAAGAVADSSAADASVSAAGVMVGSGAGVSGRDGRSAGGKWRWLMECSSISSCDALGNRLARRRASRRSRAVTRWAMARGDPLPLRSSISKNVYALKKSSNEMRPVPL